MFRQKNQSEQNIKIRNSWRIFIKMTLVSNNSLLYCPLSFSISTIVVPKSHCCDTVLSINESHNQCFQIQSSHLSHFNHTYLKTQINFYMTGFRLSKHIQTVLFLHSQSVILFICIFISLFCFVCLLFCFALFVFCCFVLFCSACVFFFCLSFPFSLIYIIRYCLRHVKHVLGATIIHLHVTSIGIDHIIGIYDITIDIGDIIIGKGFIIFEICDTTIHPGVTTINISDITIDIDDIAISLNDTAIGTSNLAIGASDTINGLGKTLIDVGDTTIGIGDIAIGFRDAAIGTSNSAISADNTINGLGDLKYHLDQIDNKCGKTSNRTNSSNESSDNDDIDDDNQNKTEKENRRSRSKSKSKSPYTSSLLCEKNNEILSKDSNDL